MLAKLPDESLGRSGPQGVVGVRAGRRLRQGEPWSGAGHGGSEPGRVGLYHLAWQVESIHDLANTRAKLLDLGGLVGESDHGVSKSLYAKDPDGIEFEVMWAVPPELWGEMEHEAITQRLDLDAELARFG